MTQDKQEGSYSPFDRPSEGFQRVSGADLAHLRGEDDHAFTVVLDAIRGAMMADSRVDVPLAQLIDALAADSAVCGRLPTPKECELLVMGDDEGTIPPELIHDFPQVDQLLSSYF